MNRAMALMGGAGVGAGLMYILDPDRGRRRRALMRDKVIRSANVAGEGADALARDARNRAQGVWASVRSWLGPRREAISDDVLGERVRARLGFLVRHPSAIEIQAQDGRITLSGPVLEDEVEHLVRGVRRVPGVRDIINRLEVHAEAGDVPGLQGGEGRPRPQPRFELFQENWSPTARALTGAAGGALALYGIRTGHAVGTAMTMAGVGLLATGISNRELGALVGDLRQVTARIAGGGAQTGRKLRDVMTPEVETVHPDATLEEAAEKMKRLDVGAIPVCDGNRLVGIITDRDIVVRIVGEKREPKAAKVRDAMTTNVVYVFEDQDVRDAAHLMGYHQIRRIVVLNRNKDLVGIVSLGDLSVDVRNRRLGGEILESVSEPAQPAQQ